MFLFLDISHVSDRTGQLVNGKTNLITKSNSLQHYNLVHKFIPMPRVMKIPAAKEAVYKEWENLEKILAWNLTKVKSKNK